MRKSGAALLAVCLLAAGCHRNIESDDAVRQGVMDYLSTRQGLNLSSMNVAVQSTVYRENQVDATVVFSPKDTSAGGQPMTLHYLLERKGDRWVVKPRATSGNPHGDMGTNPHGGGTGALPPGHPAVPQK